METYENIRILREKLGLSQEALAEMVGYKDRSSIAKIESGRVDLSESKIAAFAKALHVTQAQLMGITDRHPDGLEEGQRKFQLSSIGAEHIDFSKYHTIPILGRISAGLPIYAEENIEGYTLTDLNGGAEYFALRVTGDSMNAIGINDGYLIVVRRQDEVENGEVAVVLVGDNDATVKRFYATNSIVTLMPQSTNPVHQPQIYDLNRTSVKVLGKVVKVEFQL